MKIIHISYAGPVIKLKVNKRVHTFEMHRHCGPIKFMADGETESSQQWSEKSDFWPVFNEWINCGQKVDDFGCGIVKC